MRLPRRAFGLLAVAAALSVLPGGSVVRAQSTGVIDLGLNSTGISVGESEHQRTDQIAVRFTGLTPTGTVTVSVTSADTTVATVTPATLTFGPTTWTQSQQITVSAVDDDYHNDPRRKTQIEFAASGGGWAGVTASLPVRVLDNDRLDIRQPFVPVMRETAGLGVLKGWVALWSKPTGNVTVTVVVADTTVVKVSPTTFRFTPSNWSERQEVTWTAVDDDKVKPYRRRSRVTFTATGANFDGVSVTDTVSVWNDDPEPLTLAEGATQRWRLGFQTYPGETRVLHIKSSNPEVVSVSPSKLVWKHDENSGVRQPVFLTAVENDRLGDETATVTYEWENPDHRPVTWPDAVTVTDNDTPSVIVSRKKLSVTPGTATGYSVALSKQPNGRVTVTATSDAPGVATAHSGQQGGGRSVTLEFGTRFWNRPQSVAVYGQSRGSATFTHTVSGGGYDGVSVDSVAVTVTDLPPDLPTVSLAARPNPHVPEGTPLEVTATLSRALAASVTIPLTLTDITAEPDDHGPLESITIPAGKLSGTGIIATARDADRDDETFVVALGTLPSEVAEGDPSSVSVRIDDGSSPSPPSPPSSGGRGGGGGSSRPLTASVSCRPQRVPPGGEVRLTASASASGGELSYAWSATGGGFADPTDGSSALWTAPDRPGRETISVRVEGGGGVSASAACTVEVVNRPPVFESAVYRFELAENLDGRGQPVRLGRLRASDPDGDALTYAVTAGDRERFRTAPSDGMVTYVGPGEDFELAPNRYELTVRARDTHGADAMARVVVAVINVNEGPAAVGAVPDQPLDEGGGAVELELTPYFADPDGDPLRYRAASSDAAVVTVAVTGAVLTLTPVAYGEAAVTVTAEDPGGLAAAQTIRVGVDDRLVRAVLGDTLASLARSHLSSARTTLGRRMTWNGTAGSQVTVMGRTAPLGKEEARAAAAQLLTGWLSGAAWSGLPGTGHPGGGWARPGMAQDFRPPAGGRLGVPAWGGLAARTILPDGWSASSAGGSEALFGMPGMVPIGGAVARAKGGAAGGRTAPRGNGTGFGGGADALLSGSAFVWTPGGGEDDEDSQHRRWRVWGQGDVQTFVGAPMVEGHDARYDGELWTGYTGVDASLGERWLAGVAVARSRGESDWRVGSASGRLRTTLTVLHPYAQWSDGTMSVWAMAGGGRGGWGEAENEREATGGVGASTLGLRLGLVEARRRLGAAGGAGFGLRADAAWAELATGAGDESVDAQRAAVHQFRVGADLARAFEMGGLSLAPFGEAHLRLDGGAGRTGTGMEVVAGLRVRGGPVRLDAQGRTLAVHSAAGYRERAAALTLTVGNSGDEGLALTVAPRWGDAAVRSGALWHDEIYRRYLQGPGASPEQWTLDARGSYGMRLPSGGLLKWFGSYRREPRAGGRFLVGASIGGLAAALPPGP